MRPVAGKLVERWGQQVVVDNRSGAGGVIAGELTARAAPDGYTLIMATISSMATNVSLTRNLPYDPVRDFAPIAVTDSSPSVLVVHPSLPVKSVRDLIALAKAQPGKFAYGSSGIGGASHLAVALFASMAGVELLHVPYKGGALAVTDLLGGRLSLMFANLTTVQPHVKSGKVRALAIGTAQRSQVAPELPTVAEAGVAKPVIGRVLRHG